MMMVNFINLVFDTDFSRHFTGEDLDSLSLRELQNLELQLETALKRIRTRKVKVHIAKQACQLNSDIWFSVYTNHMDFGICRTN